VAGTTGFARSQRWNEDITEVTRSAAIAGRHLQKCVEKRKKRGSTTVDGHTQKNQATLFSRKDEKI